MREIHGPGVPSEPSRRRPPRPRPVPPVQIPDAEQEADPIRVLLAEHRRAIDLQVRRGLQALHRATVLEVRRLASQLGETSSRPEPDHQEAAKQTAVLAHVDERQQATAVRVERIEGALRRLTQAIREAVRPGDPRAVRALVDRAEEIPAAMERAAAMQRQEVQSFTHRTRQGLAQVSRSLQAELQGLRREMAEERTRATEARRQVAEPYPTIRVEELGASLHQAMQDGLRALVDRQEAALQRHFGTLRGQLEDLTTAIRALQASAPGPGSGPAPAPREVEVGLDRLSEDLAGLDLD
jgi:hypothetical protein